MALRCPLRLHPVHLPAVGIGLCTKPRGRISAVAKRGKVVEMATLGNLCVDIVLNVPALPPAGREERKACMDELAASPPDKKYWEAGGNCNLVIAASRLGLHVITLGHVGKEVYGNFLLGVLKDEGIKMVEMSENSETANYDALCETLLCWVLVDPFQKYAFCSHADFSNQPAFSWMTRLSGPVKKSIQQSKILFCNGYAFDELLPDVINAALHCAIDAGTAVFFDPGPRGRTLLNGTPDQQRALELFLRFSDVLLLTLDEVESLTGIKNPILAGQDLIRKGVNTKWVIIKMGARGSVLITKSGISCAPAFKVNVVDTVGCGDSYTAAIVFGFLRKMPGVNTLALANAVGAATATGSGAGRNVAKLDRVLELLRLSNISEDAEYWGEMIDGNKEVPEVRILSQTSNQECTGRLVRIPIQTVVSQVLQELESEVLCERRILQS